MTHVKKRKVKGKKKKEKKRKEKKILKAKECGKHKEVEAQVRMKKNRPKRLYLPIILEYALLV